MALPLMNPNPKSLKPKLVPFILRYRYAANYATQIIGSYRTEAAAQKVRKRLQAIMPASVTLKSSEL